MCVAGKGGHRGAFLRRGRPRWWPLAALLHAPLLRNAAYDRAGQLRNVVDGVMDSIKSISHQRHAPSHQLYTGHHSSHHIVTTSCAMMTNCVPYACHPYSATTAS